MQYCKQKCIAELFYEREKIKTQHRQETLSQNCSAKENEICFKKEDESDYVNEKNKRRKE